MSELLTLPRAARRVGVTARWLKSEANAGRVPHLNADGRLLFDGEALADALRVRAAIAEPLDATTDKGDAQ